MNPAVEYLLRTLRQPTVQSQVAQPVEPGIGLFEQFRQMNEVAANAVSYTHLPLPTPPYV